MVNGEDLPKGWSAQIFLAATRSPAEPPLCVVAPPGSTLRMIRHHMPSFSQTNHDTSVIGFWPNELVITCLRVKVMAYQYAQQDSNLRPTD